MSFTAQKDVEEEKEEEKNKLNQIDYFFRT